MIPKSNEDEQCPICGYYCLGKGGFGCIDRPSMVRQIPKPKTPRSPKYLAWLSDQECCRCGYETDDYRSVVPAHQSIEFRRGTGVKANDFHALPLCAHCHGREHSWGVKTFWQDMDRKMLIVDHLIRYLKYKESL